MGYWLTDFSKCSSLAAGTREARVVAQLRIGMVAGAAPLHVRITSCESCDAKGGLGNLLE